MLAHAPFALATARSWNTNSSGSAAVAANWSPSAMPTSLDDLTFARTTNYTVTFDNNVTVVDSHTYRSTNQVTLNLTTPHSVNSFITLGTVAGDDPIVVMSAGDLACAGNIMLGGISGATGHMTLSNFGTIVHTTGTTDDVIVGGTGTGVLTLSAAAAVESKDDIILGSSATGNGTANVSGGSGLFPNLHLSTLKTTGGNAASHIIVGNGGTGVLNLSSGGLADAINDVQIASLTPGNGTVTVGGSFGILGSRLHAANNIDIARNDVATAGGTGAVTVNPLGIVDADNQLRIGDPNGGTGTLHIAGGSVICDSLVCDQTGHATLTFDDGFLTIDAGTLTPPTTALTLDGAAAGDDPTLRLANGATAALTGQLRVGNARTASLEVNSGSLFDVHSSPSASLIGANAGSDGSLLVNGVNSRFDATGRSLNVGLSGTAAMTVQGGGQATTGDCVVGSQVGSIGAVTVTGANSLLDVGSILRLGTSGAGTLNVLGGGQVDSASAFVASIAGATGTANVSTNGSLWHSGSLYIGGTSSAVGGTGQVNVSGGGALTVDGVACKIWQNSTLTVGAGGTVNTTPTLGVAGTLSMSGGTVNGPVQVINGLITGFGTVNGNVFASSAVSDIASTNGTLHLGDDADIAGFHNLGTLTIGAGATAFLHDSNTALCGSVVLNGGTLNATHLVSQTTPGDIVSGNGTIAADFFNSSNLQPNATGITFSNTLRNTTSGLIVGGKINFGGAGGYLGAGTCQSDITGATTSFITPTGPLTIGANTTSGFSYSGRLNVGTQTVTLLDTNQAVFNNGALTEIDGGSLQCATGIGNSSGATIRGKGAVIGNVTNSGVFNPEDVSNPANGGLLSVQGNILFNPSSTFDVAIGDTPGSANHDRVNATGTATFNGTIRVTLKNGYVPHVGEQFIVCNATAGRTGTFSSIIAPTGGQAPCNNVTFVMVYSSTAAIVLIRPPLGCTALGDLDSDGGCDPTDIPILINALLHGPYDACADLNGDCRNDGQDIQIFLNCLL